MDHCGEFCRIKQCMMTLKIAPRHVTTQKKDVKLMWRITVILKRILQFENETKLKEKDVIKENGNGV